MSALYLTRRGFSTPNIEVNKDILFPEEIIVPDVTETRDILLGGAPFVQWRIGRKVALDNFNSNLVFYYSILPELECGYIQYNVEGGQINTTLSHLTPTKLNISTELEYNKYLGLLVKSNGIPYGRKDYDNGLCYVELTDSYKNKSVFGSVSYKNDSNDNTYTHKMGAFVTVLNKNKLEDPEYKGNLEDRLTVNSIGEGSVYVCNEHKNNIEAGDLLCSSNVSGYGTVQDDDLYHNYTFGKCTENVNFENNNNDIRYILKDGTILDEFHNGLYNNQKVYKSKLVSVIYNC